MVFIILFFLGWGAFKLYPGYAGSPYPVDGQLSQPSDEALLRSVVVVSQDHWVVLRGFPGLYLAGGRGGVRVSCDAKG